MSDDSYSIPASVELFTHTKESTLQKGQWAWRTHIEGTDEKITTNPELCCPVCGHLMYLPSRYVIATDGLVSTKKNKGVSCPGRAKGCKWVGRPRLQGWTTHQPLN